jgi:hypothetical protein
VLHLALNTLLSDWLAPVGIPRIRGDPDPPAGDWEDWPEESCPGEEPDQDEKAVNRKVDRKMRPEPGFRPEPLRGTPPQLILGGISIWSACTPCTRSSSPPPPFTSAGGIDLIIIVAL